MALKFGDPQFDEDEDGVAGQPPQDGIDDLEPEADDPTEAESKDAGEAYRESLLHFFQGVPPMPRRQN